MSAARALLACGLVATLAGEAAAQTAVESARLALVAESLGKLHAQAAAGVLPERGARAIADAVARFDADIARARPRASDAGEELLMLKLLWAECRPWFLRAPGRETARRVVERVEELAWVAGRSARASPDSPPVAALHGAALAQRLARLHLQRRGITPEEALEVAAAEDALKRLVARLRPFAAAQPHAAAELELADNQLQFLLRAAAAREDARRMAIIAKSADHVAESLARLARVHEGG